MLAVVHVLESPSFLDMPSNVEVCSIALIALAGDRTLHVYMNPSTNQIS